MAFCTKCGANIPAGIKFCTSCGTPAGVTAQPVPAVTPVPIPHQPVPVMTPAAELYQPVPAVTGAVAAPPANAVSAVMGTGAYFGTMLLFGIPIVGWLVCLIMAFAAQNLNRRNFARAMLIFSVIGIVIGIILYFIFSWVAEAVIQYINGFY